MCTCVKIGNEAFQSFKEKLRQANELEQKAEELRELAEERDEMVAYLSIQNEITDFQIKLIHEEASNLHKAAIQKVRHQINFFNEI